MIIVDVGKRPAFRPFQSSLIVYRGYTKGFCSGQDADPAKNHIVLRWTGVFY
jgi:hypothetical protein